MWEFDLQPTMVAVPRPSDQRPQPLYMAAMADSLTQQVLAWIPLLPEEDFQFQCIDLMIDALQQR